MEIVYRKAAQKALMKMDRKIAQRFTKGFEVIAAGKQNNLDVKPLAGRDGYRLRIGGYRAIFTNDGVVLDILEIGSRGDIYK